MEGPTYSNAAPAQQSGAPTLGQVAQTAQTPSEDDALVQKYGNTLQAVTKMMQPMMMQRAVPPEHQSWGHLLGSVLTMGMLPLQEHEQAARYNAYADQHNQALMLHAGGIARELVSADEHGKLEDMMQRLKVLDTEMGMARLQLEIGKDRYKRMRDATEPYGKTPEELQSQGDRGLVQSPDFPDRLTQPPGGITLPHAPGGGFAMPGSPLAKAGAPTGPAGTSAEAPTSDLGELGQRAQKRKSDAKKAETLSIPTGQTRTMAETAPDVIDAINTVRADLKNVKTGPLSSRIQSAGVGLGFPNAAFQRYQTDVGLLRGLFIKMHAGARGGGNQALINQYKQMLDAGKASPQNMAASLDSLENYVRNVAKHGPEGLDTSTTTTTPTTTTTLQTQDTSGGVGDAAVEAILRKHGY